MTEGTNTVSGLYDLRFSLHDDPLGGNIIGSSLTNSGVLVSNGLFTTSLDFGQGPFNGTPLWVQIAVRGSGAGAFTDLSPRQPLTPAPYALRAVNAGTVSGSGIVGTVPDESLSANIVRLNGAGQIFSGAVVLTNAGNVLAGNGAGLTELRAWGLSGNAGTAPGSQFLGTTDNQPLEMKVNGLPALRLEPSIGIPNVVGGSGNNSAGATIEAATIAGGGLDFYPNRVTASYGTIGGGTFNTASAGWATVAGGRDGTASGASATVGGGYLNSATGYVATVSGGYGNLAGGSQSAVAGGWANQALGGQSVVAGGMSNLAFNPGTFVGGGGYNTALYYNAAVMGGQGNTAVQNYSTIGGGLQNTNQSLGGFIGGGYTNYAEGRFVTIGGGALNWSAADHTTLGGGLGNGISNNAQSATIAGGENNTTKSPRSSIGGGWRNLIDQASRESVVAGGSLNSVASNAPCSVVSGGRENSVGVGYSTIPGGASNSAYGALSLAACYRAKAYHAGTFVWADSQNADFASTAANQFNVRAAGGVRLETGGAGLIVDGQPIGVTANGVFGFGTSGNQPLVFSVNGAPALRLEPAAGGPNVVAGFSGNWVQTGAASATIAGGGQSGASNRVTFSGGTVGGGVNNAVSNWNGTVSGGANNIAAGSAANVSGGSENLASGEHSVVAGGQWNKSIADGAAVVGGGFNTSGGYCAMVGGGLLNSSTGYVATVPGGRLNLAGGDYSFAAGHHARAIHTGAFVWADATDADFASTGNNQFQVRAGGGARFYGPGNWNVTDTEGDFRVGNDSYRFKIGVAQGGGGAGDIWMRAHGGTARLFLKVPGGTTIFSDETQAYGVSLAPGGGSWTSVSDRRAKENFAFVDPREVLDKVVALPVQTWNYKSQDRSIRHIGPIAQDFHAAFSVGESETGITSVDADGVALAAIQGLNEKVESAKQTAANRMASLEEKLQQKEREIAELKKRLERLESLLNR